MGTNQSIVASQEDFVRVERRGKVASHADDGKKHKNAPLPQGTRDERDKGKAPDNNERERRDKDNKVNGNTTSKRNTIVMDKGKSKVEPEREAISYEQFKARNGDSADGGIEVDKDREHELLTQEQIARLHNKEVKETLEKRKKEKEKEAEVRVVVEKEASRKNSLLDTKASRNSVRVVVNPLLGLISSNEKDKQTNGHHSAASREHSNNRISMRLAAALRDIQYPSGGEKSQAKSRARKNTKLTREHVAAVRIQAFFRGWRLRRQYKQLLLRTSVVREILITELDYVRFLSVLVKVYYKPLKKHAASKEPIISHTEIKTMFPQIESIQMYNTKLLDMLQKKVREWSCVQTIGDVFVAMLDFLQFPKISEQIDTCNRRVPFNQFVKKTKKFTECASMDLLSLASMPFQRIPRYTLLLKEVLKHTSKTHKDYDLIKQAIKKLERLTQLVNEKIREEEGLKSVQKVNQLLEPPITNLVRPYRKLTRGGAIAISFNAVATHASDLLMKSRQVYLFTDCVLVAEPYKKYDLICAKQGVTVRRQRHDGAPSKLRPLEIIDLKNAVLLDVEVPETEFRIRSSTGMLVFQAPNWPEKEAWMDDILNCITKLSGARSLQRVASSTLKLPRHTLHPTYLTVALVANMYNFDLL